MAGEEESLQGEAVFLDGLVEQVAKETGAETVLLFGWSEAGQEWFYLASVGLVQDFREKGLLPRAWQSLPIIVFKAGTSLFSEAIAKDRVFVGQMIRGTAVSTFCGTTLFHEEARVGSLCIGYKASNALTAENRDAFLSLSKKIASTLADRGIKPPVAKPQEPVIKAIAPPLHKIEEAVAAVIPVVPVVPVVQIVPVLPDPIVTVHANIEVPVVTEDVKPKPVVQEVIQQEVIKKPPLAPRIREEAKTRARENTLKNQEPAEIDRRHDTKVKLLESFFPALSAVFSGEDFSKEILRKIVAALECDSGYLLQFDTQSQRLFPIASENILGEIVKRIDKSGIKPDPVLGKTLDRRSPFLVPFLDWKTALKKRLFGENPFASAMMISIRSENGIWGILILCHRTQIFTQKELKLLEFIGEKISFLLETMTHWESLSKKVETMAMAQELGRSIAKGGSVVVSTLLNGIKTLMRASNCYLLLLDEQKNLLYGVAASHHAPEGISEVEIRMEEHGVVPLTVKQNHYMVIENALSDVRVGKKWVDHFRSRSLMSVPLVARERVMGVLLIDETAYFRPFTEIEIETVVGLAPSAAIAIDMAMKYQESLQRQERQDHISMSVFQTHEQECKKMSRSFGNGTGTLLEQARKQIQSAGETLSLEKMDTRKQLESACLTLDKAVLELERLSSEMFPNKLEDHGLISALKEATALFSKSTGVSVQFNAPTAIKSISPKLELHLYRIVSEALQNVHQHAHAKSLVLSIEKKDIYLHLSITDQGRGFDTRRYFALPQNKRKGVGILGMKCRIELFGGTFFIESAQEQGTRISIKVPLLRAGTGVQ